MIVSSARSGLVRRQAVAIVPACPSMGEPVTAQNALDRSRRGQWSEVVELIQSFAECFCSARHCAVIKFARGSAADRRGSARIARIRRGSGSDLNGTNLRRSGLWFLQCLRGLLETSETTFQSILLSRKRPIDRDGTAIRCLEAKLRRWSMSVNVFRAFVAIKGLKLVPFGSAIRVRP